MSKENGKNKKRKLTTADVKLGTAVAKGLGVDVDTVLKEMKHEPVSI